MRCDYFEMSVAEKEQARVLIRKLRNNYSYSDRYQDDEYEYRHVSLPQQIAKMVPRNRLMTENECIELGIQQSPGWQHYHIHRPEPHVLLFKKPITVAAQASAAPPQG